ncbi:SBBP repeat-containing protein [Alphaproteobacteria bacterium]|nr:SBBP repeat-containing protein [Alphaproteobacteria bacterium]
MVDPIPSFDFSLLGSFFQAGGGMSQSLRAEVLRKGALASLINKPSVIPPWELPPEPEVSALELRATSNDPVINKNDPLFEREDLDSDSKVLFAVFKALNRLGEMSEFIQTRKGEPLALILDSQFKLMVTELREFIDTAQYDRLSLDLGILSDKIDSLVNIPQIERAPSFFGSSIIEDRTAAISGLQTTDQFTIQSTDSTGTVRTVTITMSDISANVNDYTLDNISNHVNTELVDAGIATALNVQRYSETRFGFKLDIGFDETVVLSTTNATESESVYVSGIRGTGELGGGYLSKIDNLSAGDPNEVFFRQIDTLDAPDRAEAVAVDSNGDVYVVGSTQGDLGDQKVDPNGNDIFLQKYDAAGNLLFTRRLGAPVDGTAFAVSVDSNDNIFVAGQVNGLLQATGHGGNYDTFVTKFDKNGLEQFTRQLAPFADDGAFDMSLNSDGDIFLAGFTRSAIAPGKTHGGNSDAFITKLDNNGNLIYNRQLGGFFAQNDTPDNSEENFDAIAIAPDGSVWVSGEEDESIFIAHYPDDENGSINKRTIGNAGEDKITDLAVDNDGNVYATGFSNVAFLAVGGLQAFRGDLDAFAFKLPIDGGFVYRTFLGTTDSDKGAGITVNPVTGEAYVAGRTKGTLDGETSSGKQDNFVIKLNADGTQAWRHQFGGGFDSKARGIAFDNDGTNLLSRFGLPNGKVPPDSSDLVTAVTSARPGDYFYMSINDGPHEQIVVEDDDTFGFLAFKMRKAIGLGIGFDGTATFIDDDISGRFLRVSAFNGNKVELIKGGEGVDALESIGLKEKVLFGENPDDGSKDFIQTAFGLGFIDEISISSKDKADEASTLIDFAKLQVKKAHRLLTKGPDPEFKPRGRASQRTLDQIASLQTALDRLQSRSIPQTNSLFGNNNSNLGGLFI